MSVAQTLAAPAALSASTICPVPAAGYQMVRPNGDHFEARIGEFALTLPNALH